MFRSEVHLLYVLRASAYNTLRRKILQLPCTILYSRGLRPCYRATKAALCKKNAYLQGDAGHAVLYSALSRSVRRKAAYVRE